ASRAIFPRRSNPIAPGGLRLMRGDSALASNLSGPAQASLALRPARSRPAQGGSLSPRLRRVGHPHRLPGSYQGGPPPPRTELSPAALTDLARHTLTHIGREGWAGWPDGAACPGRAAG